MKHRLSEASLRLQVCLYYNALFAAFFMILMTSVAVDKYTSFSHVVELAVLCPWLIVEVVRLYYGYSGNLREKVPDLSTFLLITTFPQLPIVVYLAYFQSLKYPVDRVLGSIMFIFLIFELLFGIFTIRKQIRSQTSQFMRVVYAED